MTSGVFLKHSTGINTSDFIVWMLVIFNPGALGVCPYVCVSHRKFMCVNGTQWEIRRVKCVCVSDTGCTFVF